MCIYTNLICLYMLHIQSLRTCRKSSTGQNPCHRPVVPIMAWAAVSNGTGGALWLVIGIHESEEDHVDCIEACTVYAYIYKIHIHIKKYIHICIEHIEYVCVIYIWSFLVCFAVVILYHDRYATSAKHGMPWHATA